MASFQQLLVLFKNQQMVFEARIKQTFQNHYKPVSKVKLDFFMLKIKT